MACGCNKNKSAARIPAVRSNIQEGGTELPRSIDAAYKTMPDEPCLVCAEKHVSASYAEARTTARTMNVIGDLELARRHLLSGYPDLAVETAEALFSAVCATSGWRDLIGRLAERLSVAEDKAGAAIGSGDATLFDDNNMLVGIVRLAAAYRLAAELGYMQLNRVMITGDLVYAAEQLAATDVELSVMLRELRHRVQLLPDADPSSLWGVVCRNALSRMPSRDSSLFSDLLPGLRAYLGLPSDFILQV